MSLKIPPAGIVQKHEESVQFRLCRKSPFESLRRFNWRGGSAGAKRLQTICIGRIRNTNLSSAHPQPSQSYCNDLTLLASCKKKKQIFAAGPGILASPPRVIRLPLTRHPTVTSSVLSSPPHTEKEKKDVSHTPSLLFFNYLCSVLSIHIICNISTDVRGGREQG